MNPNQKVLFKETQRFNQLWIWIPLIALDIFFLYQAGKQLFMGVPFGDHPMSNLGLLLFLCFMLLFNLLFYFLKLETAITEDGIYVRFFPFHQKFKFIDWEIITKSYIRKYKPLLEFGGWGIRYGFGGKAYNVSGNEGLQLEYNESSSLLIGTHMPDELKAVLVKLGHLKE